MGLIAFQEANQNVNLPSTLTLPQPFLSIKPSTQNVRHIFLPYLCYKHTASQSHTSCNDLKYLVKNLNIEAPKKLFIAR